VGHSVEHKKKIIIMNKRIKNELRSNNTYTDFIDSHNIYAGLYLIRCFEEMLGEGKWNPVTGPRGPIR
jgi:hypothetical protein